MTGSCWRRAWWRRNFNFLRRLRCRLCRSRAAPRERTKNEARRAHTPMTGAGAATPELSRGESKAAYYGWSVLVVAALAMVGTLPGRTQGLGLITESLLRDL